MRRVIEMHLFCLCRGFFVRCSCFIKFLLPLIVLLFSGCAAIEQADRSNTERLLAAAGFKVLPANTTERQPSLESARPYKVERKLKGDEVYYFYACPDQSIAYIGNQTDYSKYRELELQQEIANQNTIASENTVLAAQQWNDWRVWGPSAVLPPPRFGGGRR
jgi:hypothetical protein